MLYSSTLELAMHNLEKLPPIKGGDEPFIFIKTS